MEKPHSITVIFSHMQVQTFIIGKRFNTAGDDLDITVGSFREYENAVEILDNNNKKLVKYIGVPYMIRYK